MKFVNLAARICKTFETSAIGEGRKVLNLKGNVGRDIVTGLDMALQLATEEFISNAFPNCLIFSEEGIKEGDCAENLKEGEWLVVDPLDGSLNFFHGMPFYGYMATYLFEGRVLASVIVLPKDKQYMIFENKSLITSQPLDLGDGNIGSTVYYAYAPNQKENQQLTRNILFELIDRKTDGFYRYGSACAGLYNLICQKHNLFIGHNIRIWDAIAFMPVLKTLDYTVKYSISDKEITLLAGLDIDLIEEISSVFGENQSTKLNDFRATAPLEMHST